MKTVVIQRDRYGKGKHGFQPGFWDFAKHHRFLPRLCRPFRAKTKGKIERFIRYLKESFYYPYITKRSKDWVDVDELNYAVKCWLKTVADRRLLRELSATPLQRLPFERQALQPLAPVYPFLKREENKHQTLSQDKVLTSALLDRLLHRSHTVSIRGNSFRLKEKLKSGVIEEGTKSDKS